MAQPSPLQRYSALQRQTDRELAAILRDAAQEADRRIAKLAGKGGIGATVERAQYAAIRSELRRLQGELWGSITPSLLKGMYAAGEGAAQAANDMNSLLFNAFGGRIPELEKAVEARAKSTVDAYLARTVNDVPLSKMVYHTQALSNGAVDRVINRAILLGDSHQKLAKDVAKFINPSTPGGVSYAANRLARTEMNNAFHTVQINSHKDSPWVTGFTWHLSGSHPKPDLCNVYAAKGHFPKDNVPSKPHPNCLCYITAETPTDEEFIHNFLDGNYDSYIDGEVENHVPSLLPKGCR